MPSALCRAGMTDKDIAAYLGVARETYSRWINHPRTDNQRQLCHVLKKAEVERKATLVGRIMDASGDSWQAAAWLLERKYPQEYAKAQRIMDTTDTAVLKAAKELVLSVPVLNRRGRVADAAHEDAARVPRQLHAPLQREVRGDGLGQELRRHSRDHTAEASRHEGRGAGGDDREHPLDARAQHPRADALALQRRRRQPDRAGQHGPDIRAQGLLPRGG